MPDDFLLQDLEDAEDALSLCDPLLHYKDDELTNWEDVSTGDTLKSSEYEHFEFSTDPKVETCPSEYIFCGKLLSSKQPLSRHTNIPKTFEFHPGLHSEPLNYKLQSSSYGTDRDPVISNNSSPRHNNFQRTSSSIPSWMPSPSSNYQPGIWGCFD